MTSGSVASSPDVEPELDRRSAGTYFPAMDGYRAVAALAVLLAHVALLSGIVRTNTAFGPYLARADVGVSVFFLLSGFLLYRPFVAARLARRPSGSLGGYVRRRALRILPAYWFALTIVAFVLKAPGFESPHSIPAHYLLLHPYDVDQVTGGPIQQSWTLATEVAFYVFLPVWAWLLARRDRTPSRQIRVEVIGLVALWSAAIGLKLAVVIQGTDTERFGLYGTWLPFRLDEFALGMGLAVASAWITHREVRLPAWTRTVAATLGCWAIAVAAVLVHEHAARPRSGADLHAPPGPRRPDVLRVHRAVPAAPGGARPDRPGPGPCGLQQPDHDLARPRLVRHLHLARGLAGQVARAHRGPDVRLAVLADAGRHPGADPGQRGDQLVPRGEAGAALQGPPVSGSREDARGGRRTRSPSQPSC